MWVMGKASQESRSVYAETVSLGEVGNETGKGGRDLKTEETLFCGHS